MAFIHHASPTLALRPAALPQQWTTQRQLATHLAPRRRPRRLHSSPLMCAPTDADNASAEERKVPFEIRGFSLANVGLALGLSVTIFSFVEYFNTVGAASASSLGFVYGVPILLIGCALKYAELQPVPVASTPEARLARQQRATEIQKKIYSDITRHRYGDEAHLSAALASLGLVPRGEACPELLRGSELVVDGEYCLQLVFFSGATPFKVWSGKIEKFEKFFGPAVKASVEKLDAEKRLVALSLTSVSETIAESEAVAVE